MAHNILADVIQGNNEFAGVIQGYSNETLLFAETSSVKDVTHKRQQVVQYTQWDSGYYIILLNTELHDR